MIEIDFDVEVDPCSLCKRMVITHRCYVEPSLNEHAAKWEAAIALNIEGVVKDMIVQKLSKHADRCGYNLEIVSKNQNFGDKVEFNDAR